MKSLPTRSLLPLDAVTGQRSFGAIMLLCFNAVVKHLCCACPGLANPGQMLKPPAELVIAAPSAG